jgi:hypothetical protein
MPTTAREGSEQAIRGRATTVRAISGRCRAILPSEKLSFFNPDVSDLNGDDEDQRVLAGRCECRAVRYEVADEFRYAANCHCSNCRASTGSAFKPFAGIERDKLRVVEGELMIVGTEDENHTRCAACGSLLYSVVRDGEWVHVALGSLEDEPGIRPTEHIFVGSKAPWYEITDDLPQNEEY